jgi:E3 ubiquitin-protein ligase UBR4
MLTSDLDSDEEKDRSALDGLLTCLLTELNLCQPCGMSAEEIADMSERSARHEVQLIIMRLLSVFMSRTKAGTKPSSEVQYNFIITLNLSLGEPAW